MRGPLIAAAALGLASAACCACSGAGWDANAGGRVVVQRLARGSSRLLSDPGQAGYCPDDSILLVIAIGRKWSSGFALRAVLPLRGARSFAVQPSLGALGTAAAVFRPLEVGAAWFAESGVVRLDASQSVSGSFDLRAPDTTGAHVSFRGGWSHVPLRQLPKGACALQ
jgi:hypothetical protein